MALSLRHWIAAALLGGATITVALWPAPESRPLEPWQVAQTPNARRQISDALNRAYRSALYVARRDEALAALGPALARSHKPITLVVDPRRARAVATGRARAIETALDSLASLLGIGGAGAAGGGVRLAVFVTTDTGFATPAGYVGFSGPWFVVPEGTDGRTCLVVLPVGTRMGPRTPSTMLGPCAFYAAFGNPGPAISQWLTSIGFAVADEGDWTPRPPIDRSIDVEDALRYSNWTEVLRLSSSRGMSLAARGCAVGKSSHCRALLDAPVWPPYRRRGMVRGLAQAGWWSGWDEREWYLADLVRAMGPERFARFWRGATTRDSAFATAFGMSVEQWTSRWLREPLPAVRAGPGIRFSSVLLGVLFAGVLVAGGAFYASRRAVG